MILQSHVQSALAELRDLAVEPGFQMRWQEKINRAIAVLDGAFLYVPQEDPIVTKMREAGDAERARLKALAAGKAAMGSAPPARSPAPNPSPDEPTRDHLDPARSELDQRNQVASTAHTERSPQNPQNPQGSRVNTSESLRGRGEPF